MERNTEHSPTFFSIHLIFQSIVRLKLLCLGILLSHRYVGTDQDKFVPDYSPIATYFFGNLELNLALGHSKDCMLGAWMLLAEVISGEATRYLGSDIAFKVG